MRIRQDTACSLVLRGHIISAQLMFVVVSITATVTTTIILKTISLKKLETSIT